VVLALVADREQLERIAERIRLSIGERPMLLEGAPVEVTLSVGAAFMHPDEPSDALLDRADQALYRAKRNGRNRIELDE
jgi:diguanylate cyclase (GGDEF)-like protein